MMLWRDAVLSPAVRRKSYVPKAKHSWLKRLSMIGTWKRLERAGLPDHPHRRSSKG